MAFVPRSRKLLPIALMAWLLGCRDEAPSTAPALVRPSANVVNHDGRPTGRIVEPPILQRFGDIEVRATGRARVGTPITLHLSGSARLETSAA